MTSTVGVGFALCYTFPGGGPCFVVRVFELFSPEMQDILRYTTQRYGRAVISEPRQAACQRAA